jgi:hypothetical protein
VIDVRTAPEWNERHIDGAVNVPLSRLGERLEEIPSDASVVVYCAGGYRSAIAASVLRRAGPSARGSPHGRRPSAEHRFTRRATGLTPGSAGVPLWRRCCAERRRWPGGR